jgi:hypothetical protein
LLALYELHDGNKRGPELGRTARKKQASVL